MIPSATRTPALCRRSPSRLVDPRRPAPVLRSRAQRFAARACRCRPRHLPAQSGSQLFSTAAQPRNTSAQPARALTAVVERPVKKPPSAMMSQTPAPYAARAAGTAPACRRKRPRRHRSAPGGTGIEVERSSTKIPTQRQHAQPVQASPIRARRWSWPRTPRAPARQYHHRRPFPIGEQTERTLSFGDGIRLQECERWIDVRDAIREVESSINQPLFDHVNERAQVDTHGAVRDRDTFAGLASAATSAV